MSADQLIRELTESLRKKCYYCHHNVPFGPEQRAYYHMHRDDKQCELTKEEQKLLNKADAFLMDG